MNGFTFLSPWRLLLLIVVGALGLAYVIFQKRRSKYAVRFTNLDLLESVAPNRPDGAVMSPPPSSWSRSPHWCWHSRNPSTM